MISPTLNIIAPTELVATNAVLVTRARALAQVPPPAEEGATLEVLIFRLGGEEYAVELRLLHGVFRTLGLTRVPCTPAFVAGLCNVRGEILTVLDLAAALGLPASEHHEVLLADTKRVRVGLQVERALAVQHMGLKTLERGLGGNSFTRGIVNAKTVLLDLEGLLSGGHFELPEGTR